jgi:hypothetical protein
MTLELRITYEGSAPGLAAHRLSLSAFSEALGRLAFAVQRTASALLSPDSAERGALAAEARLIDVELAGLEHNCVTLRLECVARQHDEPVEGVEKLAESAVLKLLDDIKAEAEEIPRSAAARRYLHALPGGVERQRYQAFKGGALLYEFECGALAFSPEVQLPRLVQIRGSVIGAKFPPAQESVSIKSGDQTVHVMTDAAGIDRALALRGRIVRVAALMADESNRLLWIRADSGPDDPPGPVEAYKFALVNWTRTLDILAE